MLLVPLAKGKAASPNLDSAGTDLAGWSVFRHLRLDSTNLEAKRLVNGGLHGKAIVLAQTQTCGQCRHARVWESAPGKGIWASFILPVSVPEQHLPQSSLVLAVAVREGVFKATGIALGIKWPNDLLGETGQKCCGLLAETASAVSGSAVVPLILGVGLNCGQCQDDFSPSLRESATSLALLAPHQALPDPDFILDKLAASIADWFTRWQKQGFALVRREWIAYNTTLGQELALPLGYGYRQGLAVGLEANGGLLVKAENGKKFVVDSGEISPV